MKFFYWYIRGITNNISRETLLNFVRKESPDIVCISEPMINPDSLPSNFLKSLKMNLFCFNARDGISKIWILSSMDCLKLSVISNSEQEITIDFYDNSTYKVTFVYASVYYQRRRILWDKLRSLHSQTPWVVLGDFMLS